MHFHERAFGGVLEGRLILIQEIKFSFDFRQRAIDVDVK